MSSHLDDTVAKAESSIQPAQVNHAFLQKLIYTARWYSLRFDNRNRIRYLDHAVTALEDLVELTPATDSNRVLVLKNMARLLYKRNEHIRSSSDLDRAIEVVQEAVELTPASDDDHIPLLSFLLDLLSKRFSATGSRDDIDRIIDVLGFKVAATPEDHASLASRLTDQATMLGQRFDLTHSIDDLHKAVELGSAAAAAVPSGHYQRTDVLLGYAQSLSKRSVVTGSFHDLNVAITVSNLAMTTTPPSHPDRAKCEHTHSVLLHRRFAQTGTKETLDAAIQMADVAATTLSVDSSSRFFYRANLAQLLEIRFGEAGSLQDLNRAIALLDDVVDNAPDDYPNRVENMSVLSTSLGQRFLETGSMVDINRAIALGGRVVESTSENNPFYARHLANLGNLAGPRYTRTELIDDLDFAIDVLEKAIKLPQQLTTNAAAFPLASMDPIFNEGALWISLGHWLAERFERTGALDDINRSIHVSEQALAKTPPEATLNRALQSHHLGRRLVKRFDQTGQVSDIVCALSAARAAVQDTPQEHIYRSAHLTGLASALSAHYGAGGPETDIEEAIALGLEALDLTATEQANGASAFAAIGVYYGQRFQRTDKDEYLDDALLQFSQAVSCAGSPPVDRADAARDAARILADRGRWEEACGMLETVMELLPHVSPRLLNNSDKQHRLTSFSGLASFAAAAALQAGHDVLKALQLLEAGRGLIGASLLELRSDLSELHDKHPDIAQRFEELRTQLDSRLEGDSSQSNGTSFTKHTQGTRLGEADEELTNLIVGIRDYPGFEGFLLPPSEHDFLQAASKGPVVVINMNYYRCDALLIQQDRIWSVPLPELKEADINAKLQHKERWKKLASIRSADTLAWLWDSAVEPILAALGYTETPATPVWPQVWWILTGPLSWLPIHAAGRHTGAQRSANTLDRVMSSYASSVKSLINTRTRSASTPTTPGQALLVAMPTTPGAKSLDFAQQEVQTVAALAPTLNLRPIITPSPRHRDAILPALRTSTIFHFAGHGSIDAKDPAKSLLLLDDWRERPLTVGHVLDMDLRQRGQAPWLGFLSACSTSANERVALVDEGVHLAGALQVAGFRHVVGTLWEVSDQYCVDVARGVYEALRDEGMEDVSVCRALHGAVRALRNKCLRTGGDKPRDAEWCDESDEDKKEVKPKPEPQPLLSTHWIPYVHFGV